jgi:imidazolonepropionase-like amidohydrolase
MIDEKKAILGGTIIDGTGKTPLEKGVLLIDGQKIKAIGEKGELDLPKDAVTIDAQGKTVIPGLIDAHMHFSGARPQETRAGAWRAGESLRAIRAGVDARTMLYMGYTGARDCGSWVGIWLKKAIEEGTIPGPRIIASGPIINNTFGHIGANPMPVRLAEAMGQSFADGVPECLKMVRTHLRAGADFIKIASGLMGESRKFPKCMCTYTFEEIRAMSDEAHKAYTILASHIHGKEAIVTSIKAGVDTVEHCHEFDEDCAKLAVEKGTIWTPTLAIGIKMPGYPDWTNEVREYLNREMIRSVQIGRERGVKIASGSDYSGGDTLGGLPLGRNAVDLQRLVEAGFSPMESIVAATKTASETIMMQDQIGTLESGKLADIVIVNGNPLDDIAMLQDENRIHMVLKGGSIAIRR